VTAEEKIIARRVRGGRINERFDSEKKRFRELVARGTPGATEPGTDILLDPRFSGRQ